jgi:hypothetical protein
MTETFSLNSVDPFRITQAGGLMITQLGGFGLGRIEERLRVGDQRFLTTCFLA